MAGPGEQLVFNRGGHDGREIKAFTSQGGRIVHRAALGVLKAALRQGRFSQGAFSATQHRVNHDRHISRVLFASRS